MQTNDINGNVLSNEWYENQRAQTRKQGFVIIKLDGKTIVDGTNSNDSTTYLKELHHKRSFDPIGFSLPINNVTINPSLVRATRRKAPTAQAFLPACLRGQAMLLPRPAHCLTPRQTAWARVPLQA